MNEVNNIPVLNIKYSEADEWIPIPAIKGTSAYVKSCTTISRMIDEKTQYGYRLTIFDEKKSIGNNSYTGDEIDVWNGIDAGELSLSVDGISHSDGSTNIALNAVRYATQALNDEQKTQARENIGALAANASSSANPIMDGTASPGSSNSWAHGDHVHPTDTSRASAVELATYTRPNLLDNWYFVGGGSQLGYGVFPINQRGNTTYSDQGVFVDRWWLYLLTATIGSEYLTLSNQTSVQHGAYQPLSSTSALIGKTVTFSVLSNYGLSSTTVNLPPLSSTDWTDGVDHIYGIVTTQFGDVRISYSQGALKPFIIINPNTDVNLFAAKLEIGSTQTLAHQENSEWVFNEVPNWSEQFYLCTIAEKSGILKATENGTIIPAVAGTDYVDPTTLSASGILKGDGSGGVSAAVAGTDYITPATNYSPVVTKSSDYTLAASDSGKTIILGTSSSGDVTITIDQTVLGSLPLGAEIAFVKDNNQSDVARLKIVNIGFGNETVGWTAANASGVYAVIPERYGMIALKKIFDTNSALMLFGNVEVST